nr:putative reverse transcriptase domain-containing protein [Tanacetum cinerariifolium]
ELAFQILNGKLRNAPVLALLDGPEDSVLYCDASGIGLGCVLMQRVADALSRKEKVKPKRVRAMNMILRSSIKDRILAAQKEAVDEFAGLRRESVIRQLCGLRWEKKSYASKRRKQSYAGKRRKPLEFSVGDYVLLKVSPWKGVVRFGKKGKFAPRFVRPFEIIKKVGPVAYRLDFPEELNCVHDTFHVSNIKKCLTDPTLQVPLYKIRVDVNLNFIEEPLKFLRETLRS